MLVASKSADLYLPTSVQRSDMVESCSLKFTFPQGPSFFTVLSPSSDGSQQNHESKHRHKKRCGIILFSTSSSLLLFSLPPLPPLPPSPSSSSSSSSSSSRSFYLHHLVWIFSLCLNVCLCCFFISLRPPWWLCKALHFKCLPLPVFLAAYVFLYFQERFLPLVARSALLSWLVSQRLSLFYTCGSSLLLFSLRSDWLQYAKSRGTIQGRELIGQFKCEEWESVRTTNSPASETCINLFAMRKGASPFAVLAQKLPTDHRPKE